jgi:hypothetical protein
MESRSEKFRRIAVRRTNEIIEKIRILGNCSNKSTYAYTDEEVSKIFKNIEQELNTAKIKFSSKKKIFTL